MKVWVTLVLAAGFMLAPAHGETETVDGVEWSYNLRENGEAWVWRANPARGDLTIPSSLGGCPVTGVTDWSFEDCSGLTSVTIGNDVTYIGKFAFLRCSDLTNVSLGIGVQHIGIEVFRNCSSLMQVTIPDRVTNLASSVFSGCSSLKNVKIGDGVTSLGSGVFCGCSNLTNVVFGKSVTIIGKQAFLECTSLTSVTIPDSVTSIEDSAFSYCSGLDSITIPDSVTNIGYGVFTYGLKTLFVPASWQSKYVEGKFWSDYAGVPPGCKVLYSPLELTESEHIFSAAAETNQQLEATANVPWRAESSASWLTVKTERGNGSGIVVYDLAENTGMDVRTATITVTGGGVVRTFTVTQHSAHEAIEWHYTVSNGQATLGSGHSDNTAIPFWTVGPIVIPSTLGGYPVTCIDPYAFFNCSDITSVTIPNSVRIIEGYAFNGCDGLTNLVIPDSVTKIGRAAFIGCSGLTSVTIPDSVTNIQRYAFMGCSSLKTMHVPEWWSAKYVEGKFWREYTCVPEECNVVYGAPASQLVLGASERTFTAAAANSKELSVTADVSWTAKSSASWLALKTASGSGNGTIVYDVAANTGTGSRTATITVTGGGITRTFTVTQCGKATAVLTLGSNERAFTAAAANSKELSVTANVSWTAKSSSSWLTLKTTSGSGNGTIVYNVAANTGTGSRTATITVTGGEITQTFTVKQSGTAPTLVLGESERSFTAEAENGQELGVTADVSWTAESSATWLEVKTSSGSGNGAIVYNVAANIGTSARTAIITVAGGGVTRTFTVTQSGSDPLIELAASSRSFTAAASNGEALEVAANVSWTAESGAAWLTVETAGGTGDGTITYDVAANPGTAERTGAITVTGGGLTRIFLVTQGGQAARLELGENARTFTADAASGNGVAVSANVPWTAASSASWLAVRTPDGTGDGAVAYDVAENPGTGERMGAITVFGSGLTRIFLVTQGGKAETQRSPVGVPCQWLEEHASGILAATGGDYEAAAMALASNGLPVWKCYVAGLSTTDAESLFKVKSISLANGEVEVELTPDLNEKGTKFLRSYELEGKPTLTNAWGPTNASSRFFRVKVSLP